MLISVEDIVGEALATLVAVEEGLVPGGAYLRAWPALERLQLEGDRQVGGSIIKRALEEPMRQIALNAGVEGATVEQRVEQAMRHYAPMRCPQCGEPLEDTRSPGATRAACPRRSGILQAFSLQRGCSNLTKATP